MPKPSIGMETGGTAVFAAVFVAVFLFGFQVGALQICVIIYIYIPEPSEGLHHEK